MTTTIRNSIQAILLWVALMIFWFACVANLTKDDMIVGVPSVILSVVFCVFVVRTLPIHFRPALSDLLQVWRLPWYVVVDLGQIVLVLARDLAGRRAPSLFRSAPWGPVANNGRDTARRTLAVAYTTVSPNCVVIGIDCQHRQFFFHQLRASAVAVMTRNLGAGDGR